MKDQSDIAKKIIDDITTLIEGIDDENRARQQLGGLVDSLISYIDTNIHDLSLSQDNIDKLNKLDSKYGEKKLESVRKSLVIDEFIYTQGKLLADVLTKSTRIDEVNLISDLIGSYTHMVSMYGDFSDKIPESLGVDLNEACLMKLYELRNNTDETSESDIYLERFVTSLQQFRI